MIYAGAEGALGAFADRHQIPVTETQAGKSALAQAHPMNLGAAGVDGSAAANRAAQAADLVIAVGTAISVAAVSTGWILSAAGEALCFIANDAARPHIHSHRYGG